MQIVYRARTKLYDAAREDDTRKQLFLAERAVARWHELFNSAAPTREADYEDFHESAAQLFAALDTGLPVFVVPTGGKAPSESFNTDQPFDRNAPFIMIGSQGVRDPLHLHPGFSWPRPSEVRAADRAYLLPSFETFAGRTAIPATFAPDCPEDGPDLAEACLVAIQAAKANGRKPQAFVKIVAQQKHSVPVIIEGNTLAEVNAAILRELDYNAIEFEGRKHAFLVQERIEMRREYRCILVGGKVVAGAGCIEANTPLDNIATFDPIVEWKRGNGGFSSQSGIAREYGERAQEIADRFRAENPDFRSGTIDLCLDENDKICLIEVNPALNFGLYALQYDLVLKAILADAAAQGPQPATSPIETGQPAGPYTDSSAMPELPGETTDDLLDFDLDI